MSKWAWGIVGTGVGAVGGAAALLTLEVGAVAFVGLTLYFATPQGPAVVDATGSTRTAAAPQKAAKKGVDYGQIQVTTAAAVTMQVDGQHVVFGPSGFLASVGPGEHRVELFDMLGRKKVDEVVAVEKGRRYTFRWKSKSFESMGVHGLIGAEEVAAAPEASAAGTASVEVRSVVPAARVEVHDPALGVDIEMDMGGTQVEIREDSRYEKVEVGGLEINVPKLGRRKGRGRRN